MHSGGARARLDQNFVVDGKEPVHHEPDDRHKPYRHLAWQRCFPFSLANVQAYPLVQAGASRIVFVPLQANRDAAGRAIFLNFRLQCNTQLPTGTAKLVMPLTSA